MQLGVRKSSLTIDINRKIHRILPDHSNGPFDNTLYPNIINFMRLDAVESHHLLINLIVPGSEQLRSQASMHARSLIYTSLAGCVPEERPMRNGRLLRRDARVSLVRIPGVQMRVQMDDGDRPVDSLERPQNREHDRVVAAERDNPWVSPAVRCIGLVVEDLSVALFHLLKGMGSIEWSDGHVSAIDDVQAFFEWVDAPDGVVAAAFFLP